MDTNGGVRLGGAEVQQPDELMASAVKLAEEAERFCGVLLGRPRPAVLGLNEYLRSAPRMDDRGAVDYARSLHSMVNTAAAMKRAAH